MACTHVLVLAMAFVVSVGTSKRLRMKVGDLVTHVTSTLMSVGLVIETGKYTGNADIKVLWNGTREAVTQRSEYLKVINESR
jgi:hypothetical protein|tara:strand:+ start:633 stop:878 length:246 start_codon:yes stop_codon:yes gene_type:complete